MRQPLLTNFKLRNNWVRKNSGWIINPAELREININVSLKPSRDTHCKCAPAWGLLIVENDKIKADVIANDAELITSFELFG